MNMGDDLMRKRDLLRCEHLGALLAIATTATRELLSAQPDSFLAQGLRKRCEEIDHANTAASTDLDAALAAEINDLIPGSYDLHAWAVKPPIAPTHDGEAA